MFHSRLFSENSKYRDRCFELPFCQPTTKASASGGVCVHSNPVPQIDGSPLFDRPLFVQFCANDPDVLLDAARRVESYCDAVDLNLGCPQGIAKKGHYGAFLQDDWELVSSMIETLHRELVIPVTAKIRILETKEKTLKYAKMILLAGASIIAVHGRTREQKGHNTGLADWSVIRYLRENLPPDTVIFANGNILAHKDIQKCLEATGADGVMSAEGSLHNPSIFSIPPSPGSQVPGYWRGRDGKGGYRLDAVMRRYLDITYKHVISNDFRNSPSLLAMRSHLFNLLRPLISRHTHIRDALARSKPGDMESFEEIFLTVEAKVQEALVEYDEESTPWWICQAYIRDLPGEALKKGSIQLPKNESKRSALLNNIAEQIRKADERRISISNSSKDTDALERSTDLT
jgi:tRNA-dihydrouridine synthase 1